MFPTLAAAMLKASLAQPASDADRCCDCLRGEIRASAAAGGPAAVLSQVISRKGSAFRPLRVGRQSLYG